MKKNLLNIMENQNQELAFPTLHYNSTTGETNGHSNGMTLRDYFAAKAMGIFVSSGSYHKNLEHIDVATNDEWLAEASYRIADAMLKARE